MTTRAVARGSWANRSSVHIRVWTSSASGIRPFLKLLHCALLPKGRPAGPHRLPVEA